MDKDNHTIDFELRCPFLGTVVTVVRQNPDSGMFRINGAYSPATLHRTKLEAIKAFSMRDGVAEGTNLNCPYTGNPVSIVEIAPAAAGGDYYYLIAGGFNPNAWMNWKDNLIYAFCTRNGIPPEDLEPHSAVQVIGEVVPTPRDPRVGLYGDDGTIDGTVAQIMGTDKANWKQNKHTIQAPTEPSTQPKPTPTIKKPRPARRKRSKSK